MPDTSARTAAPDSGTRPAPGLLRRALADVRSPRAPGLAPYVPERPFPWSGTGLPLAGNAFRPGPGSGTGGRVGGRAVIDLDRLLRLSLAVPAGAPGRLRPVPSAGALHPVRAHLLVGPGCSLPPGRYAYDPLAHRAHRRGPAPDGVSPGVLVVLTVAASRTVAHYGHRAWPLLLLDTGHAAAALALAGPPHADVLVCLDVDAALLSAAAGLPAAPDRPDTRTGADPELPLAAVRLTPTGATADAPGTLTAWAGPIRAGTPSARPGTETAAPTELAAAQDLLHHIARAPELPGGTWHPAPRPGPVTDGVLEKRRSAPPDDLTHPPGEDLLARLLTTARTARPDGPAWTAAVGGDAPALYAKAPGSHGLDVRASGDARPTLAHWAAGQQWIGGAGAVLLAHGCPGDAPAAAVRTCHLAAGYAAGAVQAHATALGLRSRPIGSWQRADLGAALGEAPGRDWIVHGLAVGAPPPPGRADPGFARHSPPASTPPVSRPPAPTPPVTTAPALTAPALTPPAQKALRPTSPAPTPPAAATTKPAAPATPPGEEERP
ncbi:nitroreductase [Streptomyces anulatus]|uniref:nitroreductase n=1 Tax=Streptomyces anulatus TaxID=1892 RepID=UPI00386C4691|nr:nitroreductase [Streptomyces anulatus]WSU33485.1 nitroreductase [Streptomyces anulatus]